MDKKKNSIKSPYTEEQIRLIRNTVARGATDDELKLFLYTAVRTGLDPLTKQIHFVKRGGQATIQTGIDGYRAIAESKGELAGIDDAVFDTETEPHPNKATVTVYRLVDGRRVSFTASARWAEYAPSGTRSFMWNKMPYLMLAKCAEALALRKAFPSDLSGIYTDEEMAQAEEGGVTPPRGPSAISQQAKEEEKRTAERGEEAAESEEEMECYCTVCGEKGVRGSHGYYCPNYYMENHRREKGGKRKWDLVGREEKERREKEAQKLLRKMEEDKKKESQKEDAPF